MSTTTMSTTQLDSDNPWPGLASFEENAHGFYFGRERQTKSLCDRVLEAPVTVLYGRSGLGKTSLLQAGLFPELRENNFLPIHVRFNFSPGAAALIRQLHQAVCTAIQTQAPNALLPTDDESIWEYFHRAKYGLWNAQNYPLTPVIVLDQFEELFTLGRQVPDVVDEFRDELGDLAENRIPADLAARIDDNPLVADEFNLRLRNYRLVICLREDFLPELEAWCRLIPALGRSRMRLLPLRVDEAVDAVYLPASNLITPELAERVVRSIAGRELHRGRTTASAEAGRPTTAHHRPDQTSKREVEPALLSLFCHELNEERKRHGQDRFDAQLLKDAEQDILSKFYESCVSGLRPQVAIFIEEELITESGYRHNYVREDAVKQDYLTEAELDQLIRSRLLRLEDRYGAQRIELTHDVLTGVVREHRDLRRAEEKVAEQAEEKRQAQARANQQREAELDRARLKEREQRLELERIRLAESERARRRSNRLLKLLALACTVALVLGAVALVQWRHAAASARHQAAVRLAGDSQLMLGGLSPKGSNDVTAIQEALAARALETNNEQVDYGLGAVLNQERDLQKIIDTPGGVTNVAFSPDRRQIAVARDDNSVQLWNIHGQRVGAPLKGHEQRVTAMAFSPDGTRLATASLDKTALLWDTHNQQRAGQPMQQADWVNGLAFSPDGTLLATAGADKTVRLWDVRSQQQVGDPLAGNNVGDIGVLMGVTFSPDGNLLATAGTDKTVRLWDVRSQQQVWHSMPLADLVNAMAFSPDGNLLATAGADKTVRLWDVRSQQQVGDPLAGNDVVMSVAFSPDGTRVAAGSRDTTIRVWDTATRDQVGVLSGHEAPVTAVAFDGDSTHLLSSSTDGTIRLWDTRWQPMVGQGRAASAAFVDDGRRIGSGEVDETGATVRWWDSATGLPVGRSVRVDDSDVVSLYPVDEDRLLSFGRHDTARLWDGHTGRPIGTPLRLLPRESRAIVVAADDTASRIAAPVKGGVQVYNSDTMQPVFEKPIRTAGPVSTMTFSPDGRTLATGGASGVELWDAGTGDPIGQPLPESGGSTSMAFSADGQRLAVVRSRTLRVWDTATSQNVGEPMTLGAVSSMLAWSPDGRTVASGGADGTIQLIDVDRQSPMAVAAPFTGHTASVTSLSFSRDGTELLSASADGTVRLWPTPSPDAVQNTLCDKITHNMSEDQWDSGVSKDIDYEEACHGLPKSDSSG